MASKPSIYLAGPVAAYEDGGAGWRDQIVSDHQDWYDFKNPLDKYNVPVDDLTIVQQAESDRDDTISVHELVESDKTLLRGSDAVLVGYSDVQSIGTPMEVMWAYERGMPVGIWIRDRTSKTDLSPWYRHHATRISHIRDAALKSISDAAAEGGDE